MTNSAQQLYSSSSGRSGAEPNSRDLLSASHRSNGPRTAQQLHQHQHQQLEQPASAHPQGQQQQQQQVKKWLVDSGLGHHCENFVSLGVQADHLKGLLMQDYPKYGVNKPEDKQRLFRLIKDLNTELSTPVPSTKIAQRDVMPPPSAGGGKPSHVHTLLRVPSGRKEGAAGPRAGAGAGTWISQPAGAAQSSAGGASAMDIDNPSGGPKQPAFQTAYGNQGAGSGTTMGSLHTGLGASAFGAMGPPAARAPSVPGAKQLSPMSNQFQEMFDTESTSIDDTDLLTEELDEPIDGTSGFQHSLAVLGDKGQSSSRSSSRGSSVGEDGNPQHSEGDIMFPARNAAGLGAQPAWHSSAMPLPPFVQALPGNPSGPYLESVSQQPRSQWQVHAPGNPPWQVKAGSLPSSPDRQRKGNISFNGPVGNVMHLQQPQMMMQLHPQHQQQHLPQPLALDDPRFAAAGASGDILYPFPVQPTPSLPIQNQAAAGVETGTFAQSSSNLARIKVVVRKRPLNKRERMRKEFDVVVIPEPDKLIVEEPKIKVDLTKYTELHPFVFDAVMDETVTNEEIYAATVGPIVPTIFEKAKATCFAYGQTGSGKTYTMQPLPIKAAEDMLRILCRPEYQALNYELYISFFEIYGGKLFDLLHDRNKLQMREDGRQQVCIVGLKEVHVQDVDTVSNLIFRGNGSRSTGCTGANMESSRSHAILQMAVRQRPQPEPQGGKVRGGRRARHSLGGAGDGPDKEPNGKMIGKLSFIDLAGSERGADTTDNDKQTRMEGAEINKSLLALKECIRALGAEQTHIPFRGSKLTEVLRDSFVGNSRTVMVSCISPGSLSVEHTLNTLRYTDRVKGLSKGTSSTNASAGGSLRREHSATAAALVSTPMPQASSSAWPAPQQHQQLLQQQQAQQAQQWQQQQQQSRQQQQQQQQQLQQQLQQQQQQLQQLQHQQKQMQGGPPAWQSLQQAVPYNGQSADWASDGGVRPGTSLSVNSGIPTPATSSRWGGLLGQSERSVGNIVNSLANGTVVHLEASAHETKHGPAASQLPSAAPNTSEQDNCFKDVTGQDRAPSQRLGQVNVRRPQPQAHPAWKLEQEDGEGAEGAEDEVVADVVQTGPVSSAFTAVAGNRHAKQGHVRATWSREGRERQAKTAVEQSEQRKNGGQQQGVMEMRVEGSAGFSNGFGVGEVNQQSGESLQEQVTQQPVMASDAGGWHNYEGGVKDSGGGHMVEVSASRQPLNSFPPSTPSSASSDDDVEVATSSCEADRGGVNVSQVGLSPEEKQGGGISGNGKGPTEHQQEQKQAGGSPGIGASSDENGSRVGPGGLGEDAGSQSSRPRSGGGGTGARGRRGAVAGGGSRASRGGGRVSSRRGGSDDFSKWANSSGGSVSSSLELDEDSPPAKQQQQQPAAAPASNGGQAGSAGAAEQPVALRTRGARGRKSTSFSATSTPAAEALPATTVEGGGRGIKGGRGRRGAREAAASRKQEEVPKADAGEEVCPLDSSEEEVPGAGAGSSLEGRQCEKQGSKAADTGTNSSSSDLEDHSAAAAPLLPGQEALVSSHRGHVDAWQASLVEEMKLLQELESGDLSFEQYVAGVQTQLAARMCSIIAFNSEMQKFKQK